VEVFLLGGGASAAAALLIGIGCARSFLGVVWLIAAGACGTALVHAFGPATDLTQAAANANFLGWTAGALLVARTRAVELLELDAQETPQRQARARRAEQQA
jgi:hypothetical protein